MFNYQYTLFICSKRLLYNIWLFMDILELFWDILRHFILLKLDTVIADSGRMYIDLSE